MATQNVHGKLYSKDEADKQFGPVLESHQISVDDFKELLKKTRDSLMFHFEKGNLHIFDHTRKVIHTHGTARPFAPHEVVKRYSTSVINDLLAQGGGPVVAVENRANVLSVTNGSTTMETGTDCPPYCTD